MKRYSLLLLVFTFSLMLTSEAVAGVLYGENIITRGTTRIRRVKRSTAFHINPLGKRRSVGTVSTDLALKRAHAKYERNLLKWKYKQAKLKIKEERRKRREAERAQARLLKDQERLLRQMAQMQKQERELMADQLASRSKPGLISFGRAKKTDILTPDSATEKSVASALPDDKSAKPKLTFWQKLSKAIFGS